MPCFVLSLYILYLGQNVEYLLDNTYGYVVIALVVFDFGVNNEYHGVGFYLVDVSVVPKPLSTCADLKFHAHMAQRTPRG